MTEQSGSAAFDSGALEEGGNDPGTPMDASSCHQFLTGLGASDLKETDP